MQPSFDLSPQTAHQRGRLLRVLGVGFGLAVIIGNTIGAGILRTPGEVAANLPHLGLFFGVWLIGGLYALLGAFSIAELGTSLPRSGGQYVFARHALGDYAGFVAGWSDWLSTCGSTAAVALVIGEYAVALFPALGAGRETLIASAVALGFALLQWRGVAWGRNAQNLTSLLKAIAFGAFIVACFVFGGRDVGSETAAFSRTAAATTALPFFVALILSLQAVIYTYDGWTGVIYFSEEVREPARDIPRALFGGVLLVIGIYLLVNLALVYVLPLERLAGEKLAAGAAAQAVFGGHGETLIRALTILSMLSSINAYHLMASRVLYAMSRDGLFAARAAQVNAGGTPAPALWLSALVSVLFILFGETFGRVIAALAFFFVATYTLSFISVFVLRRREPDRPRPYRAWGYPWTTALALVGSVAFLAGAVWSDTQNSLVALALLAISYPAFRLLRRKGSNG